MNISVFRDEMSQYYNLFSNSLVKKNTCIIYLGTHIYRGREISKCVTILTVGEFT